jgi:hypothetical protein
MSGSTPDTSTVGMVTPAPTGGTTNSPNVTSAQALEHVLDNVLGLRLTSGLRLALEGDGYVKLSTVLAITQDHINSLSYYEIDDLDDAGVPIRPPRGISLAERGMLESLKGYAVHHQARLGRTLTPREWMEVTEDDFDDYQSSADRIFFDPSRPAAGLSPGTAAVVKQTTVAQVAQEVQSFKRGIKRDQSLFPVYKQERDWDDWQRRARAQACAQGVENVLDPSYIPVLPQDIVLFKAQNQFMYATFTECIQTDFGKRLVRTYEHTKDAQSIFAELEVQAKSSTSAILESSKLLAYITTATLGKNTWNGTTYKFVLHWEEQVRLYHRYVDTHSHLGPDLMRTLLQNAVSGITDLRQVKLNAEQLTQAKGPRMTYETYRDLLLNACSTYDAERESRSTPAARRTAVYGTDIDYDAVGPHEAEAPVFGFDTPCPCCVCLSDTFDW